MLSVLRSPRALRRLTLATGLSVVAGACSGAVATPAPLEIAHELWAGYFVIDAASLDATGAPALAPDVRVLARDDSEGLFADFAGGRYDGIAASLVDLLRLQQSTGDLRLIACTDESRGADAIVARRAVRSVADLRGRRIGVTIGGFGELLVTRMLSAAGLTTEDVRLVGMDASRAPELLRADSVDAIQTWEPYLQAVVGDEFHALFSTTDTPQLVVQCLAMRERVLRDHPAVLRALLARVFDASRAIATRPDSVRARAAQALGRDLETVPTMRGVRWLDLEENRRLFGVGGPPALPVLAAEHVQYLGRTGTLRAPPDLPALMDASFLPR